MAKIKAFQAIRPRTDLSEKISALPYDVYSREEAREVVKGDQYSFLRIDRAETQLEESVDIYAPEVYQKAHDLLWDMVERGEFVKDEQACLYIYELTMNGRVQTGLVACASVDDYLNNVIMKHENTRADKEQDRINHVNYCHAQTGPIFLAYRADQKVKSVLDHVKETEAIFDFTGEDGIRHRGWMINQNEDITAIEEEFEQIPGLYIADGHHRAASAVRVSQMRRAEYHTESSMEHEYDSFLSVIFADDELYIMDYNRVIRDLNGLSKEEFLGRLSEICTVTEQGTEPVSPSEKGNIGMYLDGYWYQLSIREDFRSQDPVSGLDVSILQEQVLSPILGIQDPKTDDRIRFIGGIRGLSELVKVADLTGGVAFSMYPTSMKELFSVADAGLLMPPKSTWFEPKLRSGLFIHEIEE